MGKIKEEFAVFLDETREVASKLGISEKELYACFLKLNNKILYEHQVQSIAIEKGNWPFVAQCCDRWSTEGWEIITLLHTKKDCDGTRELFFLTRRST
jgi:hypothetical protein